jgi:hypothetical protein
MEELLVDPDYVETLAKNQDRAATDIEEALKAPADLGYNVWITHGVICFPGNQEVVKAEAARSAALTATQAVSTSFAAKLRKAEKAYEGTDHQESEHLNKQLLSD